MSGDVRREVARAIVEERISAAALQRRARDCPPRDEVERMVRAAAAGSSTAWDWLVRRFHARLVRAARCVGLGHHDAEDAAQATWVRLARHIGQLREPGSLLAWLLTTARREGLRIKARGRREQPVAEFPAEAAVESEPDPDPTAGVSGDAFAQALSEMPERHRRLMLTLAAEPPLSYAEIAAQLGIPIGSIGPIRRRCLDRLRDRPELRDLLED